MKVSKAAGCLKKLYIRFYEDDIPALGAQLAYYFLLSFFPFLIFLITLIGYTPLSSREVLKELLNILPENAYVLIQQIIPVVAGSKNKGLLSFGIITTLWAASNGVGSLVRGLNRAYDEEEKRPFWMIKGMAILFTIILAIIILLSFILLIFGEQAGFYLSVWLGMPNVFHALWDWIRYGFMLFIMTIVFAVLYRSIPNRRLLWREVMPGAVFTTASWILISLGFAYYVNHFVNYSRIYGSIGGVIVLLIWLFLSAEVMLIGGEFNATLAFDREGKEKPHPKHY
ncbi:YihY/virulence factor BrkB family protein [Petroclostridium sp. X23]|uniref:YihY/virulence factor BrkB family protein n=1 Tax=Petroclostridium sp. X23 TaxID=3045146 RepID=UPI0024AE106C|nr:YihY/virulence factor BrkB family protein [Petroclostridium sp. X23]WHH57302.1 YihY/virulence factor BrkB family protein [Petroclostridium sp. X23]